MCFTVFSHVASQSTLVITQLTGVRLEPGVGPRVQLQVLVTVEPLTTPLTEVGPLVVVPPNVIIETVNTLERFITASNCTFKWENFLMNFRMDLFQ